MSCKSEWMFIYCTWLSAYKANETEESKEHAATINGFVAVNDMIT